MTCYLIITEFKSLYSYSEFKAEVKSYPHWAKINSSTWAVVTEESVTELRDNLRQFIYKGDSLFVMETKGAAAWMNILCSSEWPKKHFHSSKKDKYSSL